jgi:hypothetical protein
VFNSIGYYLDIIEQANITERGLCEKGEGN